jgi:hypothetical protein
MNNIAMNETETTTQGSGRRPTHVAYAVRERENNKSDWRPIGVAWQHGDGKGFNVVLDALPLDGKVVLRSSEDKTQ